MFLLYGYWKILIFKLLCGIMYVYEKTSEEFIKRGNKYGNY